MAAITVEELLKETEVPPEKLSAFISDDHLRAIAIFLTSWRKVATYLGLSENDLGDVEQEGKDEQRQEAKSTSDMEGQIWFQSNLQDAGGSSVTTSKGRYC